MTHPYTIIVSCTLEDEPITYYSAEFVVASRQDSLLRGLACGMSLGGALALLCFALGRWVI